MRSPSLGAMLRDLKRRADQPGSCTDADLLTRFVAERDESAFELLVWRHGGMVFRVCRGILRREQDAEDAFQATFLMLARDGKQIGKRASLAGWLYRVAHRIACRLRNNQKPIEALRVEPAVDAPEPAERERIAALLDEIAQLPDRYRAAVVLCGLEGKTNSQAARELGCPTGTVDSRMAWARSRLRNRLTRRGFAPAIAIPAGVVLAAAPSRLVANLPRQAAVLARGGPSALAGVVSPNALTLLQGMSSMINAKKISMAFACLMLVTLIGVATNGRTDNHAVAQDPGQTPNRDRSAADDVWRLRCTIQVDNGSTLSLMFTPDSKQIVATAGDRTSQFGKLAFWDVESGKETIHWSANNDLRTIAFSPDGRQLYVLDQSGKLATRDVASGKVFWEFAQLRPLRISSLSISPDGSKLAVGSTDGSVKFWQLRNLDQNVPILSDVPFVSDRLLPHGGRVRTVAFSPDGKVLATGQDDHVRVWDVATGKEIRSFQSGQRQTNPIISRDGKSVIIGWDSQIAKLDLATGKLLFTVQLSGLTIAASAQSPDGKLIAVAAHDAKDGSYVFILDARTGKQIAKLSGHSQPVRRLAFSPDGRLLASGDDGGQVRIWERGRTNGPTASAIGSRMDRLIDDLLRSKRNDQQCLEAVFLASLGRLPHETELQFVGAELAKSKDRREALRHVAFALMNTREFGEHLNDLQAHRK